VPVWRARALLSTWWEAGASPAGLLHAIDYHPDDPRTRRGDAFRGAKDRLRVIGHRLAPWQGRLAELPAAVAGISGDYITTQREALKTRTEAAAGRQAVTAVYSPAAQAARDAVAEHLQELRTRRRRPTNGR